MTDPQRNDLDELVARYLPGVRAFVRLHMGRKLRAVEESCDLTQSVAREVLQHRDRFQTGGEAGFREWLYTTARRKILNRIEHWNAQKRAVPDGTGLDDVVDTHAASFGTPSQHAMGRESLQAIEAAFDQLTPEQREVIVANRMIGCTHVEIAERMGKTPEAVRALCARGLARLAMLLPARDLGG